MDTTTAGTILVIENDEALLAVLERRLGNLGYRCDTAVCGAQGIASFDPDRHDLVVTDLNMPGGDGIELARSIRAMSDVPIVVVTGYRDEFRSKVRTIPGLTLMEKPFDLNDLVDLVDAEISTWRAFRASA